MTVEIFIVSFWKDNEFLDANLKSITKFASGFSGTTVLIPIQDSDKMGPMLERHPVKVCYYQENRQHPFNHHQAMKMSADLWCNADFILHTDSDCMFTCPVKPDDYFDNNLPILWIRSFEWMKTFHCVAYKWKNVVFNATGIEPEYETMARHPSVHPRWLYPLVRKRIEDHTRMPFLDYCFKCSERQGLSEFPILGGYARAFHMEQYHWHDPVANPGFPEKLIQMNGSAGITDLNRKQIIGILG